VRRESDAVGARLGIAGNNPAIGETNRENKTMEAEGRGRDLVCEFELRGPLVRRLAPELWEEGFEHGHRIQCSLSK
jgi:hypothetical protein